MKKEFFAYGSILEALSFGLYPDKKHVLREFIQNAFDALNSWKIVSKEFEVSPIEIIVKKPSIFIGDKGLGMGKSEARKFRYLGYSEKDKKKTVGFRGIGKDSGLAVAERIIVTTSRYKDPKRYIIVIEAKKMLDEIASGRNPPLEGLLEKNSSIREQAEAIDSHYTFVELNNIRKDAQILFNVGGLRDYVRRNTPVPFDPAFKYADELTERLKTNITRFSYADILLNGEKLYKPFPADYIRPEYEPIFVNEKEGAPLIAYCWYCGHKNKGQFSDKENSGFIYRIKNFAVGDRHLTRKTLWHTTPERAFYFFGEIHVLDETVTPSSDRTDFEDNEARTRLYKRCHRITQILNQRAGVEADQRRFEETIVSTTNLIESRKNEFEKDMIPVQLKPEVDFEIRKAIEDIDKRLKRTVSKRAQTKKDRDLIKSGRKVLREAKRLLKIETFTNVLDKVNLDKQAAQVYQIVIDCLKEEFSSYPKRLEIVITKINEAIAKVFQRR